MCLAKWFSLFYFFANIAASQGVDGILRNSTKVVAEKELLVTLDRPLLPKGSRLLFVRVIPEIEELETIGQGVVVKSDSKISLVQLDVDQIQKIPVAGDYAVPISEPKSFNDLKLTKPDTNPPIKTQPPLNTEIGYIDLGYTEQRGKLNSTSSNQANSFKNLSSYTASGFNCTWYLDFLPNYGISLQQVSARVPVVSYYLDTDIASLTRTDLRLIYRTNRFSSKFRSYFFIENQLEEFKTLNPDEYIVSSVYQGLAAGFKIAWEFSKTLVFEAPFFGTPNAFYLEASYTPQLNAKDTKVGRGSSSSGSKKQNLAIGYTHLFFFNSVPWLKRFFVDLKYSQSSMDLNFQGQTTNEAGNFYIIPENGSYQEKNTYVQISIGLRMEDLIGRTFKPRN